ncbi:hypothetical protein [Flavobacterium sp.]|uniref:hypothetical protein n=1 Tax=Flavobacterium sp. TaxID=239 RepID=UPI0040335278
MKKLKQLSLALVLFGVTAFAVSCEEEESSSVSSDCGDDLIALADILVTRSNTFSTNPTSGNCSSLRTAALNLLSAAEDCDEYGYLYEDQAQYWIDLDCSQFD